MSEKPVSYKTAGVDIEAGRESVRKIKTHVESTHTPAVLGGIGAFGGLTDLSGFLKEYKNPVLVQSIDGVGTKLMVAAMAGYHSSIGIDIVNHGCNDVLCQGARPITFLDYVAMSKLSPSQMGEIVGGMAAACRAAGVVIVGGETAELPGTYRDGEYDVVGVVTGLVEKDEIIDGRSVAAGQAVIGLASSGLHTNGYTLARHVFFDKAKIKIGDTLEGFGKTVEEILLQPHVNYTLAVLDFLKVEKVKAIAHITGGGMGDNLLRVLPDGVRAEIKRGSWPALKVFDFIQNQGGVAQDEMESTFNMGIGLILVVEEKSAKKAVDFFTLRGHPAYRIGKIAEGKKELVYT